MVETLKINVSKILPPWKTVIFDVLMVSKIDNKYHILSFLKPEHPNHLHESASSSYNESNKSSS
jgi:hypothetical protein